jgi:formate hydrogenlyase subunit 6/NADH:ubiquinone oxidoreductase subunit I
MSIPGKITSKAVKNFFRKPVTISYPKGKMEIVANYRGKLTYDPANCTGCGLCMRYCPSSAIKVINAGTKEEKNMQASLDVSQCIFCCQCVDSCPKNCLSFTQNIDLSSLNKDELVVQL